MQFEWSKGNKRLATTLLGLGLLVICLRLPFRSHILFNWDSVNFALGILDFDVIQHRPHPPGYILYIILARVLNSWIKDSNASLVFLSMVSGLFTVLFTYLFAYQRFNGRDALVSALLVVTNPLIWFYDELALTYSLEVFFSIAISYACFRTINGSIRWAYIGAVLLGLAGGFRQTTMLIMLPLALYSARWISWKHRFTSALILTLICLAWGVPMLIQTGGLGAYLSATSYLSSIIEPSPITEILHAIFYGGHIPLLLVLAYWLGLFKFPSGMIKSWERWFFVLWIVPGTLVFILKHIGQSGYVLFTLPALFIYTPILLRSAFKELEERWPVREGQKKLSTNAKVNSLVIAILSINVVVFFLGGFILIYVQDNHWKLAEELHLQYPPSETIVLSGMDRIMGYRHASYYFPDYHVYGYVTTDFEGPHNVKEPQDVVLGWIYHSYHFEDNYTLDPDLHQLYTTLEIPSGTTGMLVTDKTIVESLSDPRLNISANSTEITQVGEWIAYVKLPENAEQLVVHTNRFEILSGE